LAVKHAHGEDFHVVL